MRAEVFTATGGAAAWEWLFQAVVREWVMADIRRPPRIAPGAGQKNPAEDERALTYCGIKP